jgi:hypothetical protein
MPLTRDFKETVQARARRDPAFRKRLLSQGIECLLAGDTDTGKVLLRDYINATIGFEELAALAGKQPKSLMRMFRSGGQPPGSQPLRDHQPHPEARRHPPRSQNSPLTPTPSLGAGDTSSFLPFTP